MEGEFNAGQRVALRRIRDWYARRDGPQVFLLLGYAGTGKTTLAREVPRTVGLVAAVDVEYAAYTGKAAHVMRSKGCEGARTLHSLVCLPVDKAEQERAELQTDLDETRDPVERSRILHDLQHLDEQLYKPGWITNENSDLQWADLLIVDEVSMVDAEMAERILSFGVKVLVLGDDAQLPPVEGKGYFLQFRPGYKLTRIHRQARKSSVLKIATKVRKGTLDRTPRRIGRSTLYLPVEERRLKRYDQVITGLRKTRWDWVKRLRNLHGLTGRMPVPGDKIIALDNNPNHHVFNGQMLWVVESEWVNDHLALVVKDDDGGEQRRITSWPHGFINDQEQKKFKAYAHKYQQHAFCTYGWAITCHSAQGSQWGSVLVVDESQWWRARPAQGQPDQRREWLYTAVTRAERRVSIIRPHRSQVI